MERLRDDDLVGVVDLSQREFLALLQLHRLVVQGDLWLLRLWILRLVCTRVVAAEHEHSDQQSDYQGGNALQLPHGHPPLLFLLFHHISRFFLCLRLALDLGVKEGIVAVDERETFFLKVGVSLDGLVHIAHAGNQDIAHEESGAECQHEGNP